MGFCGLTRQGLFDGRDGWAHDDVGEGLQHQDGHSFVLSSTVPTCVSYDPGYVYELAVVVQDGIRRMYEKGEDIFYYITMYNEDARHAGDA